MSANSTIDRVRELVDPIVADLKLDLYDLEFRGGTLRVTIDTPPNSPSGVDLEQIALVTRLVSRELDHHDPVPGHYTLEVTSPGLERTLRLPAHFQRELGKTVSVRLRDTGNADRRFQGVLQRADEQGGADPGGHEEPAAQHLTAGRPPRQHRGDGHEEEEREPERHRHPVEVRLAHRELGAPDRLGDEREHGAEQHDERGAEQQRGLHVLGPEGAKRRRDLERAREQFEQAFHRVESLATEEEKAVALAEEVGVKMAELRSACDDLEAVMADGFWPLPKYREMLFIS